jgi:hypothetical protein
MVILGYFNIIIFAHRGIFFNTPANTLINSIGFFDAVLFVETLLESGQFDLKTGLKLGFHSSFFERLARAFNL